MENTDRQLQRLESLINNSNIKNVLVVGHTHMASNHYTKKLKRIFPHMACKFKVYSKLYGGEGINRNDSMLVLCDKWYLGRKSQEILNQTKGVLSMPLSEI